MIPQIYYPKQNFTLLVDCITYNQADYIEDAMNGFAIQNTDFPFACFVIDDASTDGEQDVIKNWLDRECDMKNAEFVELYLANVIIVPHKQNSNCTFAIYFLKRNLWKEPQLKNTLFQPWIDKTLYVALCEGDDYWILPEKLQVQVDFLNAHLDYSMCFHNAMEHWVDGRKDDRQFSNIENRAYSGKELFDQWIVPTASVVLNKDVLQSDYYLHLCENPNFCYGDILVFISAAKMGKVRGLAHVGSVYRRTPTGVLMTTKDMAYFRHNLEVYNTIGGVYKEHARQQFMNYAPSLFFSDISFKQKCFILYSCLKACPLKTIKRFALFLFRSR